MWVVVVEWDDGTVAVSAIQYDSCDAPTTGDVTPDMLDRAAWLVACEIATIDGAVDEDSIERKGSGREAHFQVDGCDSVYVQQTGVVKVREI